MEEITTGQFITALVFSFFLGSFIAAAVATFSSEHFFCYLRDKKDTEKEMLKMKLEHERKMREMEQNEIDKLRFGYKDHYNDK